MKRGVAMGCVALAWASIGCDGANGNAHCGMGIDALPDAPAYAAVLSDYTSTAIALLEGDGEPIHRCWIHSGTTVPGLVATLSGDASLPTRQAGDGSLTVIDRFNTDVITRLRMPSGELVGQVRTHGELGATGFSSNPQDVLFLEERRAWVTRFNVNLDDSAEPENLGNDLLEIDPADMVRTGARVDLSSLNVLAYGPRGEGPVMTYARPGRVVRAGDMAVVGLARISLAFDVAGPGAVGIVRVGDGAVSSVHFDELRNCGQVRFVPGEPNRVLVSCLGFARPYDDEAMRRATSGMMLLEAEGDAVVEVARWTAADDATSAIAVQSPISLGGTRALAVEFGRLREQGDRLYVVDLATGQQTLVHESAGAFAIGRAAYHPESGWLLVPDAEDGMHRYRWDGEAFTRVDRIDLDPGLGLPVRSVSRLGE
jgi:hypothetical protein